MVALFEAVMFAQFNSRAVQLKMLTQWDKLFTVSGQAHVPRPQVQDIFYLVAGEVS